MKVKVVIISFLAIFLAGQCAFGQQDSQKFEVDIDNLGNANMKISMKMAAQQWEIWNNNFGNNPAAFKREMERALPKYFLGDFKLEKNDMDRSFELSLKAYGTCKINKRGKWSFEAEQKDANINKIGDRKYMLVNSPSEFGGQLQQTYIFNFPKEASEIKVDEDSFGKTVFEFKMKQPVSIMNLIRWVGIFLIAIGAAWASKNLMIKKTPNSVE